MYPKLIATGNGNWDYYLSKPFEDGSQAILYKAKENSGADSGIWCGVSRLRAHLIHLANIKHDRTWTTMIPDEWTVIDADFFKSLGIE